MRRSLSNNAQTVASVRALPKKLSDCTAHIVNLARPDPFTVSIWMGQNMAVPRGEMSKKARDNDGATMRFPDGNAPVKQGTLTWKSGQETERSCEEWMGWWFYSALFVLVRWYLL